LDKISKDLALEYEAKGIEIQVQLPFFVATNMSKIKHTSITVPSAKNFAKYSVAQLGYSDLIFPYPVHAIMFFFIQFVPTFILEKYIGTLHHNIRKKGIAKYGKKNN